MQPNILQISTVIKQTTNQNGEPIEFVNVFGLGDDGLVYEWFKNPGQWRLFISTPRTNDAF